MATKLVSVDFDPFSESKPVVIPVEHDPFHSPDELLTREKQKHERMQKVINDRSQRQLRDAEAKQENELRQLRARHEQEKRELLDTATRREQETLARRDRLEEGQRQEMRQLSERLEQERQERIKEHKEFLREREENLHKMQQEHDGYLQKVQQEREAHLRMITTQPTVPQNVVNSLDKDTAVKLSSALDRLAAAQSAPRMIVRDDNGKPVGVKIVEAPPTAQIIPLSRNADGSISIEVPE